MKPWMRSTFSRIVTESDLRRWFDTLTGKEKLEFLRSLDPYDGEKKTDDREPDDIAARIREMVQSIDVTVNATREVIVVRGDEIVDISPQPTEGT
jgi:hypothetical protein